METGVTGARFQCNYDGSISMFDMEIEQRPYHKNCSCAMHNSKNNRSSQCPHQRKISISTKQLWKECSLSIDRTNYSSQSSSFAVASRRIETTKLDFCCTSLYLEGPEISPFPTHFQAAFATLFGSVARKKE
ncbi:hypothetical protein IFM89_018584 [Coptis chinensis]|uniref:Uncharacterized protein n=1 Tax=Coptis chinensis TaxID=261450 RepID=A0A835M5B1_9MAGN|nr:hypothetical protein IFM89_018584 [Coptis chinensis]